MPAERDRCTVCLCRMRCRVQTPCKHSFCRRCLHRCYYECANRNCPLCRAPFDYYLRKNRRNIKVVFLN
ncbi:tripartite motif-containing protein 65 [Drosophila miranda]|uniref:tripartite motif-containing protein 65 n=1 Tax=Drosophila miranda TaxID=7229 RepID=UPI00143FB0DB|nr:tripartite motif-containing protein 65 [Drosophila miranda]